MEDLFQIRDMDGQVKPLKLTHNQKNLLNGILNYRFNVVKKTRDLGSDTLLAAWIAVRFAFQYDPNNPDCIVYCSKMLDISYDFIEKVRFFLSQIPNWAWPENVSTRNGIYSRETKSELVLINHCRIKGITRSRDALRGYSMSHFIVNDAAYIEDGQEIFGAALTALGTGGQATLISIPNGFDNLFEPIYSEAEKMQNNYNSINMHWAYDYRFNEGMVWTKDGYSVHEYDYTNKSIMEKLAYDWKPTSKWSEKMIQYYYNEPFFNQELFGNFLRYSSR